MTREQAIGVLIDRYNSGVIRGRTDDEWRLATDTVIAALRGPQPDPKTGLVNCGSKLTPTLPELANESEKVNHEPKLASETAEICTLRCDYCGKYAKESDLTTEYTKDKYLICRRCKENA